MPEFEVDPQSRKLESWKAIANYLRVSVRTAQVWEKEQGLPVHRRGESIRSRVLCFAPELDQWMQTWLSKGNAKLSPDDSADAPQQTADTPDGSALIHDHTGQEGNSRPRLSRFQTKQLLIFALILVALTLGGAFAYRMWIQPGPANSARVDLNSSSLLILDSRERLIKAIPIPDNEIGHYKAPPIGHPHAKFRKIVVEDIDGNGSKEVLLSRTHETMAGARGELECYEADGELRWKFPYGREFKISERVLTLTYYAQHVEVVHARGATWILGYAEHERYPCQFVLIDGKTDRLVDEYFHPGHMVSMVVADVDGDGDPELLAGGMNNPEEGIGHAALALLPIPFSRASSGDHSEILSLKGFFGYPAKEQSYILFPNIDAITEAGTEISRVNAIHVSDTGRIQVEVGNRFSAGLYHYFFDSNLNQVDAGTPPTDFLVTHHQDLFWAHKLDHQLDDAERALWREVRKLPTAPDGNSKAVESLWKPILRNKQ